MTLRKLICRGPAGREEGFFGRIRFRRPCLQIMQASEKDGEVEMFHRPHPTKEAKRYQIRAVRAFLELIGVAP